MLIDDENLFETEAGAGGKISIEIVFLRLTLYYFPHSRQNLFRPSEQSDPPLNREFLFGKLFSDDICWIS